MVTVSFTETYDLSTKTNKMTLIGVHTPSRGIFQRLYPGFLMQYAKCRIVKQDVAIACASMLPADPLQVGVDAGDIAPEDLFNPILYKAMTNDSWSTLESRIASIGVGTTVLETGLSAQGFSASVSKEHSTDVANEFNIYYGLLSDRRGWKVANPQHGLSMRNIRPLVFERWYSHGVNDNSINYSNVNDAFGRGNAIGFRADVNPPDGGTGLVGIFATSMRGNAHPMPAFNTTTVTYADGAGGTALYNGMQQESADGTVAADPGSPSNAQTKMPQLAKVMTAAIVIPPSRLHQLFYRMTVRTTVEFFQPRSMVDVTSLSSIGSKIGADLRVTDYSFSSKLLTVEESTVDVSEDASLNKVMESDH